jgi:hypothetical protein
VNKASCTCVAFTQPRTILDRHIAVYLYQTGYVFRQHNSDHFLWLHVSTLTQHHTFDCMIKMEANFTRYSSAHVFCYAPFIHHTLQRLHMFIKAVIVRRLRGLNRWRLYSGMLRRAGLLPHYQWDDGPSGHVWNDGQCYQTTQNNFPEDICHHNRRCEDLKSQKAYTRVRLLEQWF